MSAQSSRGLHLAQPVDVIKSRAVRVQFFRLMLGKIANFKLFGLHQLAKLRLEAAGQQFNHRRFTVTIGADQRYPVIHIDTQIEST